MKDMKSLLAACALLLVFGACGNGQKPKETAVNTENLVTITPDMVYCDVIGPVKRVDNTVFDRSGNIVSVNGTNPFAIEEPYREFDTVTFDYTDFCKWERDSEGQIKSITCMEGFEEFTWADGRVVGSVSFMESQKTLTVNEYDAQGRLVKQIEYNGMEDEEVAPTDEWLFATTVYTYLEFDSHGNWIRREAKYIDGNVDFVSETEEARSIEYYE